jgi:hypothetical protein
MRNLRVNRAAAGDTREADRLRNTREDHAAAGDTSEIDRNRDSHRALREDRADAGDTSEIDRNRASHRTLREDRAAVDDTSEIDRNRDSHQHTRQIPGNQERQNVMHNQSRQRHANNADTWFRIRVGELNADQMQPPESIQLMFPERNVMAALMLYHHRTGHQYVDPARAYIELPANIRLSIEQELNDQTFENARTLI